MDDNIPWICDVGDVNDEPTAPTDDDGWSESELHEGPSGDPRQQWYPLLDEQRRRTKARRSRGMEMDE